MLPQIIIASLCLLITLYGVFKKNRVFFNLGYFIFGIIVIASELSFFFAESRNYSFSYCCSMDDTKFISSSKQVTL